MLIRLAFGFTVMILLAAACGCSGCYEETELPRPPERSDAQTPAPVPGPGSPVAPESTPLEASVPPAPNALVGTKWALGDVTVTFRDESTCFAKGGFIAQVAPDGLEATYTLEGANLQVTALGQTLEGTYDGQTVVMNGQKASRIE